MSDSNDAGDRDDAGDGDDVSGRDGVGDPDDVGGRDGVGGESSDAGGDEPAEDGTGDADGDRTAAETVEEDRLAALAEEIDDEDGEWRFGLDEVGEDAEPVREPIEPESISLEHVAFVLAGVIGTLALLFLGI